MPLQDLVDEEGRDFRSAGAQVRGFLERSHYDVVQPAAYLGSPIQRCGTVCFDGHNRAHLGQPYSGRAQLAIAIDSNGTGTVRD